MNQQEPNRKFNPDNIPPKGDDPQKKKSRFNIYWVYGVVLDEVIPIDAEEIMIRLAAAGIGTRPFFWPIHEQPILRRMGFFEGVECPVASRIARRGFYLPSGLRLTSEQISSASNALKVILNTTWR